ncbi:MAG: hypothetical protein J6C23_01075 [Clostridia bacterium]|nr:hypothetical protein [Clostridia bacterium]
MKKKLLFSAIISILMCLCLMGGATFALFTDKAEVNVAITAGKVDITAEVDGDLKLYSMDRYMGDGVMEFENLGYATLTDKNKITLVNITPGDKVEFNIALGNNSNVKTKVRTVIVETGADTGLLSGLKVNVNNTATTLTNGEIVSDWETVEPNAALADNVMEVSIELPVEAGNEYQEKVAELRFTVEAVQWNGTPLPVVNEEAFKSALVNGLGEVKLESDIALTEAITISEDVVIDLNGHTLSGNSVEASTSYLIKVPTGKSLTLEDGKVSFYASKPDTEWGGVGQPAFPGYANNAISCSGTLVVDGAIIENITAPGGASYAIDCYPGANLIVNDGIVDGCGKYAIRMFANSSTVSTNVTINGGTITGSRAIWMQLPGSNTAAVAKANLTVNGGSLVSTGMVSGGYDYYDVIYTYSYGNSFSDASVILNGGEYYGDVAFGGGVKTDAHKEISIDYANCKFYGDIYSYNTNDNLTEYEAGVVMAVVSNATDLAADLATADVVVLAGDISLDETSLAVAKGDSVTLNLNGHDIVGTSTVSDASVQLFSVNGNLEIVGNGTISMTNDDFAWNTSYRYTAINIRETGVVTLGEGVKVVCEAGSATEKGYGMAYAVDIYTTGKLTVNGASLHSNYIAVRCFYGDAVVNVNSGSITSSNNNYGIWLQSSPNAEVNIASGISYTVDPSFGIYIFA